jgi:hypothetical protein
MRVLSNEEMGDVAGGWFWCWKPRRTYCHKKPVCEPKPKCDPKPRCEPKPHPGNGNGPPQVP